MDFTALPDPCDPNPCENGGDCSATDFNVDFVCNCPEDFEGQVCQFPGKLAIVFFWKKIVAVRSYSLLGL